MSVPPILVWRFYDAPEEYAALSVNGGDEDWLAFVPDAAAGEDERAEWVDLECRKYARGELDDISDPDPPWAWPGSSFGVCNVDVFRVKDGWVYIGCHA